jgi:GH43 family beta-xylosidase
MKLFLPIFVCLCTLAWGQEGKATFSNPLLSSGPDPWVEYKDGFYYYMNSTQTNLTVWKTRNIAELKSAEKKIVWNPPANGPYSHDIWAPEIHFLQGKWYIYFAADTGKNSSHRIWVIENSSPDPLVGEWIFKGKVSDVSDKWAIDASVFEDLGKLYMIWSGWEGDENSAQNIYLARMKNPWTIESKRTLLSRPEFPWEKVGDIKDNERSDNPPHVDVNEGPEILKHSDKIFLIYSASGCWTDSYALGMLTATSGSDLLDASSWKKSGRPVFQQNPAANAFGPGHNSFFKSPDGKQDWIIYHANPAPGQGCGEHRSPRTQPFIWNSDGSPSFGLPVGVGVEIPRPQ